MIALLGSRVEAAQGATSGVVDSDVAAYGADVSGIAEHMAVDIGICDRSVELSSSNAEVDSPLDIIHVIVAGLSARRNGGWVDILGVSTLARKKGVLNDTVIECLDTWRELDIMRYNEDCSKVQFAVSQLCDEARSECLSSDEEPPVIRSVSA